VAGVYIILTRYMLTMKTHILNALMRTLPKLILRMIQLPLTAPAPNQQPLLNPSINWCGAWTFEQPYQELFPQGYMV
jgi:hypothetical protein